MCNGKEDSDNGEAEAAEKADPSDAIPLVIPNTMQILHWFC